MPRWALRDIGKKKTMPFVAEKFSQTKREADRREKMSYALSRRIKARTLSAKDYGKGRKEGGFRNIQVKLKGARERKKEGEGARSTLGRSGQTDCEKRQREKTRANAFFGVG